MCILRKFTRIFFRNSPNCSTELGKFLFCFVFLTSLPHSEIIFDKCSVTRGYLILFDFNAGALIKNRGYRISDMKSIYGQMLKYRGKGKREREREKQHRKHSFHCSSVRSDDDTQNEIKRTFYSLRTVYRSCKSRSSASSNRVLHGHSGIDPEQLSGDLKV